MEKDFNNITSFCESNYKPCDIELQNIEIGNHEVISFETGKFKQTDTKDSYSIQSTFFVKDRYSVSDHSYHELSMLSELPSSSQIKKLKSSLNSKYNMASKHPQVIPSE